MKTQKISRIFEISFLAALILAYIIHFHFLTNNTIKPWWIILLGGAIVYTAIQVLRGQVWITRYFLILIPLSAASIWQFGMNLNLDLSPIVIITVAILYFCFRFNHGSIGVIVLMGLVLVQVLTGSTSPDFMIWLPVFAGIWGLMFWLLKKDRELFRSRFETMKSRARDFLVTHDSDDETLPGHSLAEDTQIAKAAASVIRVEESINRILAILHKVLHPYSSFFFLLDNEEGYYKVLAHNSKSKFFDVDTTVEMGTPGVIPWVVEHNEKLRYERLPRNLQHPPYYAARERILSCLVFPVRKKTSSINAEGRLIENIVVEGVLGVDSKRSHSFDQDEVNLMEMFAILVSDVIMVFRENQRKDFQANTQMKFYDSVKKILETNLNLKERMTLLIESSQLIKDSEEIAVAVPNDEDRFIIRETQGIYMPKILDAAIHPDSICGRFLTSDENVVIFAPERSDGYLFNPAEGNLKLNSLMIVKLAMENRVRGLLILGSQRREYYDEQDKYMFSTLAAQFGFALENAMKSQRISELAITDGLTGLHNHRQFQDFLASEIKRARREPSTFSLLLFDIDYFKKFNDTHGHQAGDEVLKKISALLKSEAREIDLVARYGGEEFVMIFLNCDLKMAAKNAERIRKLVSREKVMFKDQTLSVTVSIGVANYPTHTETASDLISLADKALYKAKAQGRNRVVMAVTEPDILDEI